MRRCHRVMIACALLAVGCGSTGSVATGPEVGSSCTDLGATECTDYRGNPAVAFCAVDKDTGNPQWQLGQVCSNKCDLGQCVGVEDDSHTQLDNSTPPDQITKDEGSDSTPPADALDTLDIQGIDEIDVPCVPQCDGKVCGDDGCGGTTCGKCVNGEECLPDGSACCKPQCQGKLCGDNGCGGVCGTCPAGNECGVYFQCVPECVPKCDGRECGPNGCNTGTCGTCPAGKACGPGGLCTVCTPNCTGKVCGDDGCGGSCGGCLFGYECQSGTCVKSCIPVCANKNCGDDGCGGSCGECYDGEQCVSGHCLMVCSPDCEGRVCGTDGCGGNCGKCAPWEFCTSLGQCVTECEPQCLGKICGPDGCGSTCGTCGGNTACNSTGQCIQIGGPCSNLAAGGWCDGNILVACVNNTVVTTDCLTMGKNVVCEWLPALNYYGCNPHGDCVPNCLGKDCGDDGCGGSCGECQTGQTCELGQCTGVGQCGDVSYVGCCSANTVLWCDNSSLWYMDCTATGDPSKAYCGWNSEKGFYDCVSSAIEGPLSYPYYCGGTCVPDCINRQCGDDGCGGTCGECPKGLACQNNHCVAGDGGCGLYTSQPACQEDMVVWCEDGHIVFTDCSLQGQNYTCGWVPDLYVYSCYEVPCVPNCTNKKCGPDGCGYTCGYCPSNQYCNDIGQCVNGVGPCGDIDYVGVCDGNVVKWCQNSILQTFDCANLGPTFHCGWFDQGYYWCIN